MKSTECKVCPGTPESGVCGASAPPAFSQMGQGEPRDAIIAMKPHTLNLGASQPIYSNLKVPTTKISLSLPYLNDSTLTLCFPLTE